MTPTDDKLRAVPLTLADANAFVEAHHRHCKRVQGHRFSLGVVYRDGLVGVAIVGRPVARKLDDGITCEVTRLCVLGDAPANSCSFLYRRAWSVWAAMGGHRLITYTLQSEHGTSLRASGWKAVATSPSWPHQKGWTSRKGRVWQPVHHEGKVRWEIVKP